MKIQVTLDGGAGELDANRFEVADNHPQQEEVIHIEVVRIIEKWNLAVGDTIRIREI